MFYSNKNFSIFTVGKHGTTAIYDVIAEHSNGRSVKINKWLEPYRDADIPCYIMPPEEYNVARKFLDTRENYVIVRDPTDRFTSGLVDNVIGYYSQFKKVNCIPIDFNNFDIRAFRYDKYHVAPFMSCLTQEVIDRTTFVHLKDLDKLIERLFGAKLEKKNTNDEKIVRGSDGSAITGADLKDYFHNNIHHSLVEILHGEIKAYNHIKSSAAFLD